MEEIVLLRWTWVGKIFGSKRWIDRCLVLKYGASRDKEGIHRRAIM